jgi:hypothetical protein
MKSKIAMIIVIMGLALGGVGSAFGSSNFPGLFNSANGTSYGCNLCHTSTSSPYPRNQFGTDWANASIGNHSYTITSALANLDSDGDGYTNIVEIQAKTNPGDATSFPTGGTADTIAPTVSAFTLPGTATSLTVSITTLTATDNVGVTGYLVNEGATKPLATAAGWSASVPTGYSFTTTGPKTLYAWAKDAAGNVSNSLSQTVTITAGEVDVESPEVMEFTLPLTSTSLTVPILAFRAIDNVAPTAYLITTTPAAPSANAAGWSATPPTSYTFTSGGAKTLYGWARDAAGNISESVWDNVDITVPSNQTPPGGDD